MGSSATSSSPCSDFSRLNPNMDDDETKRSERFASRHTHGAQMDDGDLLDEDCRQCPLVKHLNGSKLMPSNAIHLYVPSSNSLQDD